MPQVSDQLPLVPPALRRFQAVKDQQTVLLKHNSPDLCSKGDDYLTPSDSQGCKIRRHPKSTVHGVVNQFGQLHEQKSGLDSLLSSVGNVFRRMCTQEGRTLRLLGDSQNVEVIDVCPDQSRLPSQESVSHIRGDRNSIHTVDTGKEGLPRVMITTFKEPIPSQKIHNRAGSKSHERATVKSKDGTTPKSRERSTSKSHDEAPSKSHEKAKSERPEKATSKSRDEASSKSSGAAMSQSHEEAAPNSSAHSHRRMRWTSASNKKQFEVSKHETQQSTDVGEKLDSSDQSPHNTGVLRATPERSKLTQLSHPKHRKFNLSKLFRIKRNSWQRYSLPLRLPLGTERDQPQALLFDPELDDNSFDSFDSREGMALESSRLSFLQQSSSSASDVPNHSQNNIISPGRKSAQVKSAPKKIRGSAGVRRSTAGSSFTCDMTDQGYVTRRPNTATSGETLQRFSSDSSLAKCEHLGDSTDDLTQLIYVAF